MLQRTKYVNVAVLFLSLTAAFSWGQAQTIQTEYGSYKMISPVMLATLLNQSERSILLINTQVPYRGEIATTDSFLPFNDVETFFPTLPKDKSKDIVVYSLTGENSATAAETLVKLGYSNVHNLAGGMVAWQEAGYSLTDAYAQSEGLDMDMVSSKLGIPRYRFVKTAIVDEPFLGDVETPLVLVEFSDFNCPYCARFHAESFGPLVATFVDTGQMRYVYRDFVSVGGNVSLLAAEAVECASEQVENEPFFDLLNALYASNGQKTAERVLALAEEAGLDQARLDSCVAERRSQEEVLEDLDAARAVRARGTPAFVLGYQGDDGLVEGIMFQGALPLDTFRTYITAFIEAAK